MDKINKSSSAGSFNITCARDHADSSGKIWGVSSGRIFLNGSLVNVPGISFVGDADVYLTIGGEGEDENEGFHLSTEPVRGNYSRKIISVQNGQVVLSDLSSLSLGVAELQEHDTRTLTIGGVEPEYVAERRRKIAEGNTILCPFFEDSYADFTGIMDKVEGRLVTCLRRTKSLHEQYGMDTTYIDYCIRKLTTYADDDESGEEPEETVD